MAMHDVARFMDLREDKGLLVELDDRKLLLLRVGDQARAYQAECPHAGAPLVDGAICEGRLICPWHKAAFAVDDGSICEPPALDALIRYRTDVLGGQVLVDDQPMSASGVSEIGQERCYVIVGGGAAGVAAACALRERGFAGRLLLIDREAEPGYDRTVLSKFVLAGQMRPDQVPPLRDAAFYSAQHIERIHGEVMKLDALAHRVTLIDGQRFDYDAALIATGGEPRSLSVLGADLPGVMTLRSRDDTQHILAAAPPGSHVLIVGDGFIGLEAASALRQRRVQVTVLAHRSVPLAGQLGERIGQALRTLHERQGVLFRTNVSISRFEGDGYRGRKRVDTAVLDNGERLAVDMVLVATGINPATHFLDGVELDEHGAVRVDAGMQASRQLWAVGDIAAFPLHDKPVRIEHWRLAQQHARIAAANMLGEQQVYQDVPFFWTYHYGKRVDYLGHAEQWSSIVYRGEPERFEFMALLCQDDQVKAVVACERERQMALLAERLRRPLTLEQAERLLDETD